MLASSQTMLLVPVAAVALIILIALLFIWRWRGPLEREIATEQGAAGAPSVELPVSPPPPARHCRDSQGLHVEPAPEQPSEQQKTNLPV
ncbi:MAG: hypothetical protein ACLQUY_24900 [Ktedonobacterales bacterium]